MKSSDPYRWVGPPCRLMVANYARGQISRSRVSSRPDGNARREAFSLYQRQQKGRGLPPHPERRSSEQAGPLTKMFLCRQCRYFASTATTSGTRVVWSLRMFVSAHNIDFRKVDVHLETGPIGLGHFEQILDPRRVPSTLNSHWRSPAASCVASEPVSGQTDGQPSV